MKQFYSILIVTQLQKYYFFRKRDSFLPVVVRNRCAGHFDIVTTQEEEKSVARQTDCVRDENKLHSALGLQLKPLQQTASHEDAYTGTWYGD